MRSRAAVRTLGAGVLVAALSGVVVSGASATPSGTGPGNSPNAKQCQKGGWQNLVTSTGASFASEGACTSYAAQGGTLFTESAYLEQQWQTICQNAGGTFSTVANEWQCQGGFSMETARAMAAPCVDAGGTPEEFGESDDLHTITCNDVPA